MLFFNKTKKNQTREEERRRRNNEFIKRMGVACLDTLPLVESSKKVKLKDFDTICKRAIASFVSGNFAVTISENGKECYDKEYKMFWNIIKHYGVEDSLLNPEKKIFDNKYSERDIINVSWENECFVALAWVLGLIDTEEMAVPNGFCNWKKVNSLVGACEDYEAFKNKAKIRDVEEILDMLDLYYRYHWACTEKMINARTNIGELIPDIVWERRKALEWLISKEADWNAISLDT